MIPFSRWAKLVWAALVLVTLILTARLLVSDEKVVSDQVIRLNLRTRVKAFKAADGWQEVTFQESLPVKATAVVICDMWDNHWCTGAARRVNRLAKKMSPVVK